MKNKMNRTVIYNSLWALLLSCVMTACVDMLEEGFRPADANEVGFKMLVSEQKDMTIGVGGTRGGTAAGGQGTRQQQSEANHFLTRQLDGEAYGLNVVRMSLPLMGIHPGTVTSELSQYSESSLTRSAWADRVTSAETFHDSLTVWGYTRDAATTIFDKTLVQRVTNWRTSGHWPFGETGPMRFYAVSPSMESINISVADADYSTPPVLTYTLPEKAQDMCDLLYGESGDIDIPSFGTKESHEGKEDKMVNLQFQHILTAVRFAQGNIPAGITVKSVSIKNVNTRATFVPSAPDNMTDTQGTWSGYGNDNGEYTMWANFDGTGASNTYINDSVFFMLPQIVQSGVELEVVIECTPKYSYSTDGSSAPTPYTGDEKQTHTLKCSLAGDVWKKGYTVTYLLTIGEVADGYYFLAGGLAESAHSDVIETHNFTLHSFRQYVDKETDLNVTTHGANWKVVGYYSDASCTTPFDNSNAANIPSWLPSGVTGINSLTLGEFVGSYNGTASYNLAAQTPTKGDNHRDVLDGNASVSDMDLSLYYSNNISRGSQQTANCYIINRKGSYKFPIVYGNRKNEDPVDARFVDHLGAVISEREIKAQIKAKNPPADTYVSIDATHQKRTEYTWNVTTGASDPISLRAVLVWQDVNGMLSGINATEDYIQFTQNSSYPGNAVIALQARKVTKYEKSTDGSNWSLDDTKGSSDKAGYDVGEWETLWTWHIWMTDEVYANEGTNGSYSKTKDEMYLNWNATNKNHLVALKNWGTNGTDGVTKDILPVNLGWVPEKMDFVYYSPREVYVKLQQLEPAEGGATAVVHIVQHAKQPLVRGTGTFYQWGRPTALPGHNYTDDPGKTVRTIYRNADVFPDFTVENITNTYDAIAQPTKLFRIEGTLTNWSSANADYWGSSKTVYDPCPPGFQVPDWEIFTGFSVTGKTAGKANDAKKLNMWDDAGGNFYGGYFYVDPHVGTAIDYHIPAADRYKQTVYMPATGQYQATKGAGSVIYSSTSPNNNFVEASPCTVWSNERNADDKHAHVLNLYPDFTRGNDNKPAVELPRSLNLSTACGIRPVEE